MTFKTFLSLVRCFNLTLFSFSSNSLPFNEVKCASMQTPSSARGTSQEEDNLSDSGHNSMTSLPPYRPPLRPHLAHIRSTSTSLARLCFACDLQGGLVRIMRQVFLLWVLQCINGTHQHHRLAGTQFAEREGRGIRGRSHRRGVVSKHGNAQSPRSVWRGSSASIRMDSLPVCRGSGEHGWRDEGMIG